MAQLTTSALGEVFPGDSTMAQLMQNFDWSQTPLGPAEQWPQSLKTSVSLILGSQHPMWIGWGPEMTFLYNDAYISVLSLAKHPTALGKPASVVWQEIWDVCGPLADKVFGAAEASFMDDVRLFMSRGDYLEETFYSFSYSPIRDESGKVGGLFCPSTDVTAKNVNTRRLRTLSLLSERAFVERSVQVACKTAVEILAENRDDVPFAMLYLVDPDRLSIDLWHSTEFPRGLPTQIPLAANGTLASDTALAIVEALRTGSPQRLKLDEMGGALAGPADQPISEAVVVPVTASGEGENLGVLLAGINPACRLDEDYQTFFSLISAQIATAVANAKAYEDEAGRAESLAQLDRAKTLFFSDVSHEFRTPLALMLGPLEDLQAPGAIEDPAVALNVQTAYRNSLRLLKLVNTLLDFSRIEAGRIEAIYEPTDLGVLTADLASTFRSAVERAGLRFVVECATPSRDAYIDRDSWEKIVLNLLSNALKFTFYGEIKVTLREVDGDAELSVTDTGVGIAEEDLSRVFERFYRIRGAESRSQEGSGIGLSLVQELVYLHGGAISADSTPGVGTTFTVRLPLGKEHLPANRVGGQRTLSSTAVRAASFVEEALRWLPETDHAPVEGGVGQQAKSVGLRTILVADDNADMREYITRLLSEQWNVIAVGDGEAALQAARREQIDLVLSDVMMPKLDGFGLLSELRKDEATASLPIILLSARAGEEAKVEGLESGADDYMTKPFSARELTARIAALLERKQAEVALAESQRRYRQLVEGLGVAVYTTDRDGVITLCNDAAIAIWGREPRIGIDRWSGCHRMLRSDGSEMAPDEYPLALALSHGEPVDGLEVLIERPDGSRVWLQPFPAPLRDSEGHVIGGVNAFIDITARKDAEAALAEYVAQLQEQTAIVETIEATAAAVARELDLSKAVQAVTDAATQLTGAEFGAFFYNVVDASGEKYMLYTLSGVDPENFANFPMPRATDLFGPTFQGAPPMRLDDVLTDERYGHWAPYHGMPPGHLPVRSYLAAPVVSKTGEVLGGLFFGHQTPGMFKSRHEQLALGLSNWASIAIENARLYSEAREAEKQMAAAAALKDQFLGLVSHELRTPISTILGNGQLLLRRGHRLSEEDKLQCLLDVVSESERLQGIIENLLILTRLDAGKELMLEPIMLPRVVQDVVEALQRRNPGRSIALDAAGDIQPALGEGTLIKLVLENLISNAVKYSAPEHPVEVVLRAEAGHAMVHVLDRGIGFDDAEAGELFNAFYRSRSAADHASGMGLGLAVSRRVVEAQSGSIGCRARPEGGSEFFFSLPYA